MRHEFFAASDCGRRRQQNEDAYLAQNIWDDEHLLLAVIDGVGGYSGGEVAAEITRNSLVEYLTTYTNGECLDLLKRAIDSANQHIVEEQNRSPYPSMCCVATAALLDLKKLQLHIVHIGDTRLYLYTEGKLTKLTNDDSLVGYQEEQGVLTEEQAMHHPNRNEITKVLGDTQLDVTDSTAYHAHTLSLPSDFTLFLCSDGLYDMVYSHQILHVLQLDLSAEDKVHRLIDAANQAGGKDNITVVLVECEEENPYHEAAPIAACTSEPVTLVEKGTPAFLEKRPCSSRGLLWAVWSASIFVALMAVCVLSQHFTRLMVARSLLVLYRLALVVGVPLAMLVLSLPLIQEAKSGLVKLAASALSLAVALLVALLLGTLVNYRIIGF